MSEFHTTAYLSIEAQQNEIRELKREIEDMLSDVALGLDTSGGDITMSPDSTTRGQLAGILDANRKQADLLAGGDSDGGGGQGPSSRERRRRRREFRWGRQNTSNIEDAVTLLESIDNSLDDGGIGGGGGGVIGGVLGVGGRAGGGAAGAAAGGSIGATALGIGGGIGLAGAGVGIAGAGVGAARGEFASEELSVELGNVSFEEVNPTLEGPFINEFNPELNPTFNPVFNPRFDPEFSPVFNPEFNPEFNPRFEPEFNPEFSPDFDIQLDTNLEASVTIAPTVNISPSVNLRIDTDFSSLVDEAADAVEGQVDVGQAIRDEVESEISGLERRIERELR